jgi:hypothetical protein
VRVFDNGCWSLWSNPFIITGIDDISSFKFKLFPSPATDIIYLEALENKGENTAEIKIIDLHGKLVKSNTINDLSTHSNHAISIENLASGVYLMIVKIGNENIAIQFVKENR